MQIPDEELVDQDGNVVSLRDLVGATLVVFFYPKAMTPGCTQEACDFRDRHAELLDAGYEVVGISPDPPERNAAFKERHGLPFHLLSDPDHRVAEQLGAWGLKKMYGREYEGLIRSTFVFDEQGETIAEYRNVRAKGHVSRLLSDLAGG